MRVHKADLLKFHQILRSYVKTGLKPEIEKRTSISSHNLLPLRWCFFNKVKQKNKRQIGEGFYKLCIDILTRFTCGVFVSLASKLDRVRA